jgi:predicted amidohydrolase YtcJ
MMNSLLIRDAEIDGIRRDVRLGHGRVLEIGSGLRPVGDETNVIDAEGGALIPGLTDHHIHLYATAADLASTVCGPPRVRTPAELAEALRSAAPDADGWIRGMRYHESVAGLLDAARLDALRADVPVRVQHRSGALWMLNSLALKAIGMDPAADGRLWRSDDWLRSRLPVRRPPSLRDLGRLLAGYGITAVTDATPNLAPDTVEAIGAAVASGDLPQRVQLLGAPLGSAHGPGVGPWKLVLADSDLPTFDELCDAVDAAHRLGRPVAVHTVTRESLVLLLAVLEQTGSLRGDRLEHAALVPAELIAPIRRLGLRVVTQPGFIADRGDDYLREVPTADHADLYRCASLRSVRIPVALSSDAPYGPLNPWAVIAAAATRRTRTGAVLGRGERLSPRQALAGYLGPARRPGAAMRHVLPGARADLVLLRTPLHRVLTSRDLDPVRLCLIRGQVVEGATLDSITRLAV